MSFLLGLLNGVGPVWGWVILFVWGAYQLYWPFSQTKLQGFHDDFTNRLERIEVGQIAIAEETSGVSEKSIKELHGQEELSAGDLKT